MRTDRSPKPPRSPRSTQDAGSPDEPPVEGLVAPGLSALDGDPGLLRGPLGHTCVLRGDCTDVALDEPAESTGSSEHLLGGVQLAQRTINGTQLAFSGDENAVEVGHAELHRTACRLDKKAEIVGEFLCGSQEGRRRCAAFGQDPEYFGGIGEDSFDVVSPIGERLCDLSGAAQQAADLGSLIGEDGAGVIEALQGSTDL